MPRRTRRRGSHWRLPLKRFVVADRSMEPSLFEGQALLGLRSATATVGELRVLVHPNLPDFWLVKRVDALDGTDAMIVRSDDRDRPTVDSATFGAVPVRGSYRVIWQSKRLLS